MVPAGKHFEADDLAGGEIHLRFEKRNELAVLETVADALLDLALGDERPFHARVEPYGPGDAPALRPIHGHVGARELAVGKRKSDRKFVAAEARDDRIRSERFVERPRDLAQ